MSSLGSVTVWIEQLKAGDPVAVRRLWERYFHKLVGLARVKLRSHPRAAADEEDVALSAFDSFIHGIEKGRFPQLKDRDNLWQLLIVLASRKACGLITYDNRQKRGGGAIPQALPHDNVEIIADILSREPTPQMAALFSEECQRLMEMLDDDLKAIAQDKVDGYSNAEIASRQGVVERTVERRLNLIRKTWSETQDSREQLSAPAS